MAFDIVETQTDKQAEKDGVWVELEADAFVENGIPIGACVKVASYDNPAFASKLQHLMREKMHVAEANGGYFPVQMQEEFENQAAAKHLVMDWQEIVMKGDPYVFSEEHALWLLRNHSPFRATVFRAAREKARFRKVQLQADVKNS